MALHNSAPFSKQRPQAQPNLCAFLVFSFILRENISGECIALSHNGTSLQLAGKQGL